MSKKIFIGIDNGVTGTLGVISQEGVQFIKIPVKKELSYTKKKAFITRIDFPKLKSYLYDATFGYDKEEIIVGIERPMVNPGRFVATSSALRALESLLIIVELLELPFEYVDSKEWQKNLLPANVLGPQLKVASLQIGNRLFPQFKDIKHEDRDGILIAEYYSKKFK